MSKPMSHKRIENIRRNETNLDQFIAALKRIEQFKQEQKEKKPSALP